MRASNFVVVSFALLVCACPSGGRGAALSGPPADGGPVGLPAGDDGSDLPPACQALLREICGILATGEWTCEQSASCQVAYFTARYEQDRCEELRTGEGRLAACAGDFGGSRANDDEATGGANSPTPGFSTCPGCNDDGGPGVGAADGGPRGPDPICTELVSRCCGREDQCAPSAGCLSAREVADRNDRAVCNEALGDVAAFPACAAD